MPKIVSTGRIENTPMPGGGMAGKFKAPDRYTKELDRMLRQDDELMEMVAQMFMEIEG